MNTKWRPVGWVNPYIAERTYFNDKYGNKEGDSMGSPSHCRRRARYLIQLRSTMHYLS